MSRTSGTKHILVVRNIAADGIGLKCNHCSTECRVTMPQPCSVFIKLAKAFVALHAECRAKAT